MKKPILMVILSLFLLGIWGNVASASQLEIKFHGNTKAAVKVEHKNAGAHEIQFNQQSSVGKQTSIEKQPRTEKQASSAKILRSLKLVDEEFTDVQNDWSREQVLEATVKGYVYGYEDCTFRPSATVSKMETIVLIMNAKGYGDEVKRYVLTEEQKALLVKIPDWGKNYIALALDKGILTKAEVQSFNPQQAAKRYEVCMYMSRILDEDEDEEDAVETSSSAFNDENQIPELNKEDVRLMWINGIIKGYPDGSFQPMRAVKRNELITMLNKLDDNCLHSFDSSTVAGTVKEIKAIEGGYEISVVNEKGETVTVKTNSHTKLSYEGKLASTTIELNSSAEVKIFVDENGEAVLVKVISNV